MVSVGDKLGFIDKKGGIVVPIQYDDANDFTERLTAVELEEHYYLVDKFGQIVPGSRYEDINIFSEGFAVVEANGKYHYVNNKGERIIQMVYDKAGDFTKGKALVANENETGFIDKLGKMVLKIDYDWSESYSSEYIRVKNDGNFGLIQSNGREIIPCEYQFIGDIKEGFFMVAKNEKFGFINENGELDIPLKYAYKNRLASEGGFYFGMAKITRGNKYGFVDTSGAEIVPPVFEDVKQINSDFFRAKKRGKWGVVTRKMKLKVGYKYENLQKSINGNMIAAEKGKYGLIDLHGVTIIPFQYNLLEHLNGQYYTVHTDSGSAVLDTSGVMVITLKPSRFTLINERVVLIECSNKMAYFNLVKNSFMWKEEGFEEVSGINIPIKKNEN